MHTITHNFYPLDVKIELITKESEQANKSNGASNVEQSKESVGSASQCSGTRQLMSKWMSVTAIIPYASISYSFYP